MTALLLLHAAMAAALLAASATCMCKKKPEPTRSKSRKSVKITDEPSSTAGTNKTDSRREHQANLMETRTALKNLAQQQQEQGAAAAALGRKPDKSPPTTSRNRRPSVRAAPHTPTAVSHTAKRSPTVPTVSITASKNRPSYTAKESTKRQRVSRGRASTTKGSVTAKKKETDKKKREKEKRERARNNRLNFSDEETESETSDRMRHRLTFPEDPYNPRLPSYTAPDGRVYTPKVEPLTGKQEEIAVKREFRRPTEYPTMDDIKSMWDTIEDKEGAAPRTRASKKKQKPIPSSSGGTTFTAQTSGDQQSTTAVKTHEEARLTPQQLQSSIPVGGTKASGEAEEN